MQPAAPQWWWVKVAIGCLGTCSNDCSTTLDGSAIVVRRRLLLQHLFRSQTAMVGDRFDTDIALGKQGGLVTVLVLTGVATRDDVERLPLSLRPDYVLPFLASLVGYT